MTRKTANTYWVKLYLAGDINVAKQVCREECYKEGLCVTIEPCDYIYTGGEEAGYCVGLINYPKFPSTPEKILERAKTLASKLMERTCQHSVLIMNPTDTEWLTLRENTVAFNYTDLKHRDPNPTINPEDYEGD